MTLQSIKPDDWPERFYAGKAVIRFPNGLESGSWYSKPQERGEATCEYVRADIAALPARGAGVKPLDLDDEQTSRAAKFMAMALWSELHEKAGEGVLPETLPKPAADVLRKLMQEKLAPTDAAQEPFRIEDMTLADLMRDPLYEEATTTASDAAQAREAALHDRITEALVAAQERAHRAYEQDAPFDPNEHKVRISVKDTYAILALIGEPRP